MNNTIKSVRAREIIDSRSNPTIETEVVLSDGSRGVASVPSGASTGKFEAVELRDNDKSRFNGKGVLKAVENVNETISKLLTGKDFSGDLCFDRLMRDSDGSDDKSNFGANATLSVSLACAKAYADSYGMQLYMYLGGICKRTLPIPMMNILNGGAHASNNIDIQEFMIVPCGFSSFSSALRAGCEIYQALGKILKSENLSVTVGDEGGFAPNLNSAEEAIEYICKAIKSAGYDTDKVKIALDVASSEWYEDDGTYHLPKANTVYTSDELISKWETLSSKYPIISIEDPLSEDDWGGWAKITEKLGKKIMLVGDDLFVTNEKRLKKGIDMNCGNSILIKPNQIGTLEETVKVVSLAHSNSYKTILSHRSGETDDTSICDIAVALGAGFIKAGAPCRMDRVCKYNRLLKIENELYMSQY